MTNLEMFGERLKKLRKMRKMSQEKLAEKSDISSKYLSRIELGYHFPSLDIIVKFAKILDVPLEELFQISNEGRTIPAIKKRISKLLDSADRESLLSILKILDEVVK